MRCQFYTNSIKQLVHFFALVFFLAFSFCFIKNAKADDPSSCTYFGGPADCQFHGVCGGRCCYIGANGGYSLNSSGIRQTATMGITGTCNLSDPTCFYDPIPGNNNPTAAQVYAEAQECVNSWSNKNSANNSGLDWGQLQGVKTGDCSEEFPICDNCSSGGVDSNCPTWLQDGCGGCAVGGGNGNNDPKQPTGSNVSLCSRTVNDEIPIPLPGYNNSFPVLSLIYNGNAVQLSRTFEIRPPFNQGYGNRYFHDVVFQAGQKRFRFFQNAKKRPDGSMHIDGKDPEFLLKLKMADSQGTPLPSGMYFAKITTIYFHGRNNQTHRYRAPLPHINLVDSPIGRGWGMGGVWRAVEDASGSVFIFNPGGGFQFFENFGGVFKKGQRNTTQLTRGGDFLLWKDRQGVTMTFDMSASAGLLIQRRDALNRTISYVYDDQQRLISIRDPYGAETVLTYDGNGLLSIVRDSVGRETHFEHDVVGNLTAYTDAEGVRREFHYDSGNKYVGSTNGRGYSVQYEYDGGKVRRFIDQDGYSMTFSSVGPVDYEKGPNNNYIFTFHPRPDPPLVDESIENIDVFSSFDQALSFSDSLAPRGTLVVDQRGYSTATMENVRQAIRRQILRPDGVEVSNFNLPDDLSSSTTIYKIPLGYNGLELRDFYLYDKNGNVVFSQAADGSTGSAEYNDSDMDLLTLSRDAYGNETKFSYDPAGNLTEIEDPLGNKTIMTYFPNGLLKQIVDPEGLTQEFLYDARGNLIHLKDLLTNSQTSFERDSVGRVTKVLDSLGRETRFSYDSLDRLVNYKNANGQTTSYVYDQEGNLTSMTDSVGNVNYWEYDSRNLLVRMIQPMGRVTQFEYDGAKNLVKVVKPDGAQITYNYDEMNRLKQMATPTRSVSYSYGLPMGNIAAIGDNDHLLDYYVPNSENIPLDQRDAYYKTLLPSGEVQKPFGAGSGPGVRFALRDFGTPPRAGQRYTQVQMHNLPVTSSSILVNNTMSYDEAGRLTGVFDLLNSMIFQVENDKAGRVVRWKKTDGTRTNMGYDGAGRLISIEHLMGIDPPSIKLGAHEGVYSTASESLVIRGQVTDPGATTLPTATINGQPLSLSAQGDFEYTASLILGENNYKIEAIDAIGFSSSLTVLIYRVGDPSELPPPPTPKALVRFDYSLDAVGNITVLSDSRLGVTTFNYDPLDRLREAVKTLSGPAPGGNGPAFANERYDYDPLGNRLASHLSGVHSHNAANQLTQDDRYDYAYDLNGNRSARVNRQTGEREEYHHDAENRLLGYKAIVGGTVVRQARYVYDPRDRRIAKYLDADGAGPQPPQAIIWHYHEEDLTLEVRCAYTGTLDPTQPLARPTPPCEATRRWLHGPGIDQPLAMVLLQQPLPDAITGSRVLVYHTDHLGSVQSLSEISGSLYANYYYDAYGNILAVTDSQSQPLSTSEWVDGLVQGNPFTFTGRELDVESGLYYYRARYYDPQAGRFLEEDSKTLNSLYSYAKNNPINYYDDTGFTPKSAETKGFDNFAQWICGPLCEAGTEATKEFAQKIPGPGSMSYQCPAGSGDLGICALIDAAQFTYNVVGAGNDAKNAAALTVCIAVSFFVPPQIGGPATGHIVRIYCVSKYIFDMLVGEAQDRLVRWLADEARKAEGCR